MKIELKRISVAELVEGYEDNDELGVRAFAGALDVRPPYQREFVYKDRQRDAVVETVRRGFPLNVMYWAVQGDGTFEVIDGQQRTISICQFVEGDFSVEIDGHKLGFHNLQADQQDAILAYELMVYLCDGTDSEKLDWFKTINIAGERLTDQELRNAVYHGPWVTAAKKYFSKSGCPAYQLGGDYLSGSSIRQDYLETAIRWHSADDIDGYMALHQHDADASALWDYFSAVIAWVEGVFTSKRADMKHVEWGPLHARFSSQSYDPAEVEANVARLVADPDVTSTRGIYEYLLGGGEETRLLSVRVFDEKTKRATYARQTTSAAELGVSNCPLCAVANNSNATRVYSLSEMDADHVTAWSKGGATDSSNCEMLCTTHNRAKGNR